MPLERIVISSSVDIDTKMATVLLFSCSPVGLFNTSFDTADNAVVNDDRHRCLMIRAGCLHVHFDEFAGGYFTLSLPATVSSGHFLSPLIDDRRAQCV